MCGDGVQLYPPALSYKIHLDVYFKEEVLKSQIWGFNRSWKISLYLFPNMIFLAAEHKN